MDFPNLLKFGTSAFEKCSCLKELKLEFLHQLNISAFKSSSIENFSSESIDIIPYECFVYSKIKSVWLPNVSIIQSCAFYNCVDLIEIHVPNLYNFSDTATSDGYYGGIFENCISLRELIVPKLNYLPSRTLYNCNNLVKVNLENVQYFDECRSDVYVVASLGNITTLSLPKISYFNMKEWGAINVEYLYLNAAIFIRSLSQCKKLKYLEAPKCVRIDDCSDLQNFTINGIIHTFGQWAFSRSNITYLKMQTKIIEQGAFLGCNYLEFVELPSLIKLESNAFRNCKSLKSFIAPLLTKIDFNCFEDCTNLSYIYIPLATEINPRAFSNTALSGDIVLNATDYYGSCFDGTKIENLIFNNYVTIYQYAFQDIPTLKTVTLSSGKVMSYAFQKCKSITTLYLNDVVILEGNSFDDIEVCIYINLTSRIRDDFTCITLGRIYKLVYSLDKYPEDTICNIPIKTEYSSYCPNKRPDLKSQLCQDDPTCYGHVYHLKREAITLVFSLYSL